MLKKASSIKFTAIMLMLVALVLACSFIPVKEPVYAANDLNWNVRVTTVTSDANGENVYTDLNMSGTKMTEKVNLVFLISYHNPDLFINNDSFYYYESDRKLNEQEREQIGNWANMGNLISRDIVYEGQTITYKTSAYDPLVGNENQCDKHIYFKRTYTDGDGQTQHEIYNHSWHIIINLQVQEEDLGISNIKAEYQGSSGYFVDYRQGDWINKTLRVTVTTKWMERHNIPYNPADELLFYSIDGKQQWIPMSSNVLLLSNSLQGSVYFKVTNVSQSHSVETQEALQVSIDVEEPKFNVSAVTTDINNNQRDYANKSWASGNVLFQISRSNNCLSPITYFYTTSAMNGEYMSFDSSIPYICRSSVKGLKFKARTAAGTEYTSMEWDVNIDSVKPVVLLEAFTAHPSEAGLTKPLVTSRIPLYIDNAEDFNSALAEHGTLYYFINNNYVSVTNFISGVTKYFYSDNVYYSNGEVIFNIYNKGAGGNIIPNTSPLFYEWAVDNGPDSVFQQMRTYEDIQGVLYGYHNDAIASGISTLRKYLFRIRSQAGLVSDVVSFETMLVNSYFTIEVEEITYTANTNGWASSPIPVYVQALSDTKAIKDSNDNIIGYTEPTTQYIFYYAPVEVANLLYSAIGECVENVAEGVSRYRFYLSASANSAFIVYAENMAGKASQNTYQSEEKIMIDTTKPEVWYEAFMMDEYGAPNQPTTIEVHSGEWVNGRVHFTLKAKIGISSVYAYRLYYVEDAYGNPLRDENGKIIWLDTFEVMKQTSVIEEAGANVACYYQSMELPNQYAKKMTEYYGFRVYTGSGVYTDVEFVINIDTTDIMLDSIIISDQAGGQGEQINILGNQLDLTDSPVSKDFFINLVADAENGPFNYLIYNQTTGQFEEVDSVNGLNFIQAVIPFNKRGTNSIQFKLRSKAKGVDYKSGVYEIQYKESGIYEIIYSYNTLEIDIDYSTSASATPDMVWEKGNLNVTVKLQIDGEELSLDDKEDYTYWYMLIDYIGFVSENDALRNGTWIECSAQNQGSYDILNQFNFIIPFENVSFNGYVALSVCHKSGHRSSKSGFVANRILIDNTTPDVREIIVQTAGENQDSPSQRIHTYFSKDSIILRPVSDPNRSKINFYYYEVPSTGIIPEQNPVSPTDTKQWTLLDTEKVFGAIEGSTSTAYRVLIYAVNELGERAGGIFDEGNYYTFEFIIDTSPLAGALSYSPADGGLKNDATGLWSYQWRDTAVIYLSSRNSNTQVSFWYSIDGGQWQVYNPDNRYYNAGDTERIVFDSNIFPDGVMGTFSFKVVNRAGQEYYYTEKIYIAMDNTAPDFTITLTVNEAEYNGGSTDFTDTTGEWSSVDIVIKIDLTVANVSGTKFTYKIYYYRDNTMKTAVEGLPLPNVNSFSSYAILSDSTLFPNRSGDVILEITATNMRNADKFTTHSVRMRIDKTVPTFELKGLASSSDSSTGVYVESGQWTNHTKVVVSRANPARNVSAVRYFLTYEDLTSTSKEQYEWDAANSSRECTQTCTITVRAISEAGLEATVVFQVNIDTIPPVITFMGGINVVEGEKHYIDLKVVVNEENIKICQYITVKGETAGFPLDPKGYIISTSSVDNSTRYDPDIISDNIEDAEYRGYVKIIVEDYAGNRAEFSFYMLPFNLTVNNITLSNEDARTLEKYEEDLNKARIYMESSRVTYFENLIQRLKDRVNTLHQEINGYRAYLEKLSQRISYELKSDYDEMFSYLETYNNYELFGQAWIQKAIVGDGSSKYFAYFNNLKNAFAKLDAQMKKVQAVQENAEKLPAINVVESADYNAVLTVFDQYNNLTADQKACFKTTLYTKILELKRKCEVLLLTDPDTGISIDGNFAPGAKIKITEFKSTDETYINSQQAIMSALTANDPRAIVSINRIGLTDAASQTSTGKVTVQLPIPEDWQQYITFAVYKVTEDGTVSAIENIEIQGDGKSVIFTSDELSTFVLCAKANIQSTNIRDDVFGTLLGLEMDVRMIKNLVIVGAFLFGVVIVVVIITGIRRRKFLNSYNKAYRASRYRKKIQEIPYGNTFPRSNPLKKDERVKTPKHPY
ncbi:MAG: hypothetical protein GX242_05715 [Clostridiales bacterium]|nr:hypothetical protein [Clostridiales bacterium]